MLRVDNIRDDADIEAVRDALDYLGVNYEHVRSEPEDYYPQTAYFYVPDDAAMTVDGAMRRLSEERGLDAELL